MPSRRTKPAGAVSGVGNGTRAGAQVPLDRSLQPLAEGRARAEAEQLLGAARLELAARLTVRLRRVPDELALEAGQLGDELGQVADRDLLARAEVDGLGAV